MKAWLVIIFAVFFSAGVWAHGPKESTGSSSAEELQRLDHVLEMRPTYDAFFYERIRQLHVLQRTAEGPQQLPDLNFKLAHAFSHHNLDSTLFYIGQNIVLADETGNPELRTCAELYKAFCYALSGFHVESGDIISSYQPENLSVQSRYAWYMAARKLSFELKMYSPEIKPYLDAPDNYRSNLLAYVEEGSYEWHEILREEAFCTGDREQQEYHILKMLELSVEGSNRYATACYYYSTLFPAESEQELHWLLLSAMSDVMSSTKDYQSLLSVAQIMFHRKDISRSFRYLADYCLPDAIAYNGKLRPLQVSKILPEVETAYQEKLEREKDNVTLYMCLSAVMVVILILLMTSLSKRNKILTGIRNKLQESRSEIQSQNGRLKEMNRRLQALNLQMKETDQVKEEYISLFLSMLSEHISTNRQYKSHVLKYLRRGHVQEIIHEIEEEPSIDEDINEFYKMFDRTFINMYPDFVSRFNTLLQEGEEVLPKGEDLLSPDLRIYALVKLGISDPGRIAALLHYSTNTIYNYKARIKNKAKGDREKFDEQVKNLYTTSLQ